VISYRTPSNIECKTCHISNEEVIPIRPKKRNMNIDIPVSGVIQNQLSHLYDEGVLNAWNPSSFSALPNYQNTDFPDEHRA
jgi:hypothetical protein